MTIGEAIAAVDILRPNSFEEELKRRWLQELDERIYSELIVTHEAREGDALPEGWAAYLHAAELAGLHSGGGNPVTVTVPDYRTAPLNTRLLVGSPWESMYIEWLRANIDRSYEEFDKYNASISLFNGLYGEFKNAWGRTHMPKSARKRYY